MDHDFFRRQMALLAPPTRVLPSQWCSQNITLPVRASAIQGDWSVDAFPYPRGPIDVFVDDSVESIVLQWATQLGKTMMLVALMCYTARIDPGPSMIATSNETSLKELVTTKIYPTFEGSASLRNLLLPQHKRSMFLLDLGDMLTFCAITTCPRVPSLLAQSAAAAGVLAGEGV